MSDKLKDMAVEKRDILMIDPRKIQIKPGFNVRQDYGGEDYKALKASIAENGVRTPLRVFTEDGQIFVESGHRRIRAVQELIDKGVDIKTVPVIEDKGSTEEQRTLGLILDNDGLKLKPIEEAAVFERLSALGWTDKDIALKTGRSQAHVSNMRILLNHTNKTVQKAIIDDKVSSSFVLDMIRETTAKAKEKKGAEINPDEIRAKINERVNKAIEKAKEIGQKKATKKIEKEGTRKKTDRKKEKNTHLEMVKRTFALLQMVEGDEAREVSEYWEEYAAKLTAAAV